jgi:hypothetical protein
MTLHLEISPQTQARLAAAALVRGIDISTLIELLAVDYLPPVEVQASTEQGDFGGRSLADLMAEIGFAEGGPSDMSENPGKYMKGFGETKSPKTL